MRGAVEIHFFHVTFSSPIEEIKRQYLALCKKYHPDLGGSVEDMAQINAEFDFLSRTHSHIHEGKDGGTYEKYDEENQTVPGDFMDLISHLVTIKNITIELVGCFVWVSGETYPVKDTLKEYGLKYSGKHKKWYFAPVQRKHKWVSNLGYDDIKSIYGCQFSKSTEDKKHDYVYLD